MMGDREIEAYCANCAEPTHHVATEDDPGTCACKVCGEVQQLMVPIN